MSTESPTPRTFPVNLNVEDGWTRVKVEPVHGVEAAHDFGAKGNAHALAFALCDAIAPHRRVNPRERSAIAHVIEQAVRHAGYYAYSKGGEPVDFEYVELSASDRTLALLLWSFAGASSRDKPGRFLVAYNLQVFIGARGALRGVGPGGERLRGFYAQQNYDYFGRGSAKRAAKAERAAGKVS